MAIAFADRCKETTTTTGTGTLSLNGPVLGYRAIDAGVTTGSTVAYCITSAAGDFEVGTGVITSGSPDTLTRATVLSSSNANALVNFAAGTKYVYLVHPASLIFKKDGDTMTGYLTLNGDPTSNLHAATKQYVDATAQGLSVKQSVVCATTTAGTLASSFANGSVIDGITLATGNRILVKNQADSSENGIYTVNASGAPTRALDFNAWSEVVGAFAFVESGTVNTSTGWFCNSAQTGTIGTTAITFTQFSGAGLYTAGTGLSLTGSQFANTGVTAFNTRTGAVTLSSSDVTTALGFTPLSSSTGVTSITGTTNQITASASTGSVTLSLPTAVTLATSLTISALTANSFLYSGAAGLLTSTAAPTNGQLLIGSTGAAPVKAALTAGTAISVTNGAGSISIANTGVTSITGTTNQITASASTGSVTLSLPQSIDSSATPTFGSLTLGAGNLAFTTTGQRITGDFSNATLANRVMFQTGTTNGASNLGAIPNGTSTSSAFGFYTASDVANSSKFEIGAFAGQAYLDSNKTGSGTYLPMLFYTGGAERLRIDTSGRVGIGVTPSAWGFAALDVASTTGLYGNGWSNNMYYDGSNWKYKTTSGATLIGQGNSAITFNYAASGTAGNTVSLTESMRIDSSGILFVGTTSVSTPNGGFALIPNAGGSVLNTGHASGTPGGWAFLNFNYNGGNIGSIAQAGTTAVSYNTTSDYRLKQDVQPMYHAIEKVMGLAPVTFQWKADGRYDVGFIAHELQQVAPECVTGTKDAVDGEGNPIYQGIDPSKLITTLTKAIQELKEIVDEQAARIAALENK